MSESAITCLSVVGCTGNPILKQTLKALAKDRYVASVRDDQGTRMKLAGHLRFSPENAALLEQHDVQAVLVYRDPRDNLISLVNRSRHDWRNDGLTRPGTHPDARAFHQLVKQSEGTRDDQGFVEFYVDMIGALPTLQDIFQVVGWKDDPRVHAIRLEDLVDLWGDDPEAPRGTLEGIAAFLGIAVAEADLDRLVAMGRTWVRTRAAEDTGFLTRWQDLFCARDREVFKEHFGRVLIELGYEQDDRW